MHDLALQVQVLGLDPGPGTLAVVDPPPLRDEAMIRTYLDGAFGRRDTVARLDQVPRANDRGLAILRPRGALPQVLVEADDLIACLQRLARRPRQVGLQDASPGATAEVGGLGEL